VALTALLASLLFAVAVAFAWPLAAGLMRDYAASTRAAAAPLVLELDGNPNGPSAREIEMLFGARTLLVPLLPVFGILASITTGLTICFFVAALAAIAMHLTPRIVVRMAKEKHIAEVDAQLPDVLAILVRSVRSQGSLSMGFAEVVSHSEGAIAHEFARMRDEYTKYGLPLELILERARDRVPTEGFRMMTSALSLSLRNGGDLPLVLDSIARATRELKQLRDKITTEASSVRGQMQVMIWMAPVFIFLSGLLSASAWHLLFATIPGNLLLVVIFLIQLFAWLRMRQIVRSIV
jgi:Flp pilus assembly protein TadB